METIKRREALKRAAWIMGGTLSAPAIAGIMSGCTPNPELTWAPSFFNEAQAKTVMEIAERIIPKTSTPGAKDLGVPAFIEDMVSLYYNPADRTRFMEGLEQFMRDSKSIHGDAFFSLDNADQVAIIKELDDEIKKGVVIGETLGRMTPQAGFFWHIKQLTVIGYYTTEYGTTKELQYVAVPVNYEACVPLSEAGNGKTWATT